MHPSQYANRYAPVLVTFEMRQAWQVYAACQVRIERQSRQPLDPLAWRQRMKRREMDKEACEFTQGE